MFTNLYIVCSWDHELIKCLSVGGVNLWEVHWRWTPRPLEVSISRCLSAEGASGQRSCPSAVGIHLWEVSIQGRCKFVERICCGSFACVYGVQCFKVTFPFSYTLCRCLLNITPVRKSNSIILWHSSTVCAIGKLTQMADFLWLFCYVVWPTLICTLVITLVLSLWLSLT